MYAKQIIFAALSAATVAVASPTPGPAEHLLCRAILENLVTNLLTTVTDTTLIDGGAIPVAALLRTSIVVVNTIWKVETSVGAAISKQEVADIESVLATAQGLLNGTDAQTIQTFKDLTQAQTQFTLISSNCETE